METNADKVQEFHQVFGLTIRDKPFANIPEKALRRNLMFEELLEYCDAVEEGNIVAVADSLADLLYVVYGTAITHGIPIDAIFAEVHRSNMTKLGDDGQPIQRVDGKILKSQGWEPPDLERILVLAW